MKNLNQSAVPLLLVLLLVVPLTGCGGSGSQKAMELGGINTGEVLQGLLTRTRRAMSQVTNVDSAQQAKVDLIRINEDYDDLLFHIPKLSDEGRAALAKESARALPEMQAMVNRVHEMPALDEVLGATLDQMLAKMAQVR